MAKFLDFPIEHLSLELDEIQSMDLFEIVEHKVRQAYEKVKKPVLVEDISLEFEALGGLPGPFIKFFMSQMTLERICKLLKGDSRKATAKCVLGYFDGTSLKMFGGSLMGEISNAPTGDKGFGWDKIFIPSSYETTRALMNETDYETTYKIIKPVEKMREYLHSIYFE